MIKSSPIRLGLNRISKALEILGHPEDSFSTVLVAGTNGKGSVSALVENILHSAGYRTGLFTSPHLVDVCERVKVDQKKIAPAMWNRCAKKADSLCRRYGVLLTEFEWQALAAFLCFHTMSVQIAVVEVGLGGRLDATNALPAPEATAITSIGYDHMKWLGSKLINIYSEKRSIARPGTPLIQSVPPFLRRSGQFFCQANMIPTLFLGKDIHVSENTRDWHKGVQMFDVSFPGCHYQALRIPLMGKHQVSNAALAVGVCESLRRQGWALSEKHIRRGLFSVVWPGRFQIIDNIWKTRHSSAVAILDGAHNKDAVRALVSTYKNSPWKSKKVRLIFGCLQDKDAVGMIRLLKPIVQEVFTVSLSAERSCDSKKMADLWRGYRPARAFESFTEAWREIKKSAGSVLITGSLYLVGDALQSIGANTVE